MLIIFESPDKTGKTTLARKLSEFMNIQYLKLNNINILENEEIKKNISVSTHSQLETVTQLFEKGVMNSAILDRFHGSEYVYSRLFKRKYDISYISSIEQRLFQRNNVILVRCRTSLPKIRNRWNDENLIDEGNIGALNLYYNDFYKYTKLPVIEIDTDGSVDKAFAELLYKLSLHGVSENSIRNERITHTQAMINVAKIVAKRSPCITRQVGAVITEDGYVVGVGYNGPPSGLKHDTIDIRKEKGFSSGEGLDYSRDVHAEQNAIMQSGIKAKRGSNLELFTTSSPCIHCMRMLIQIGVQKIYYIEKYNHPLAWEMAKESNIEMIQIEE